MAHVRDCHDCCMRSECQSVGIDQVGNIKVLGEKEPYDANRSNADDTIYGVRIFELMESSREELSVPEKHHDWYY